MNANPATRTLDDDRTMRGFLESSPVCPGDRSGNIHLLGNSPGIRRLREQITMIADSRGTVLLWGESGTGKEVAARAIHESGIRRDRPFIRINGASFSESPAGHDLFGKGANGGTLLLEEISDIPLPTQGRLLGLVQEQENSRSGNGDTHAPDVRIIATTNGNLLDMVRDGKFREDLFYRLNVIPLHLAPLRERKDDIPQLAAHFCQVFCEENNKPPLEITEEAMGRLLDLEWPGNVRQLRNVIERAVVLSSGHLLDDCVLGLADEMDNTRRAGHWPANLTLKDMERELILGKLANTRGNRTQAARELGISVRTLRNKLNLYTDMGVEIPG